MSKTTSEPILIDRDRARQLFQNWHETEVVCEKSPAYYAEALVVRLYNKARAGVEPIPKSKDTEPPFAQLPVLLALDYLRTKQELMFWHMDEATDEEESMWMGERLIERMRTEATPQEPPAN